MTARNRTLSESGQAVQAAVKAILAAHSPLASPLTAKAINKLLPAHLRRSDRDIRYHRDLIYKANDSHHGNVSADLSPA
jgi:hypothetical protein